MPHQKINDSWIKIYLGLGVLGLLAFMLVPLTIKSFAIREIERQKDCLAGRAADCEPSLIWALADLSDEAPASPSSSDANKIALERASRSSERSPEVVKVILTNPTESLPDKIRITAWVEGETESVEVRFIAADSPTPGIGKKIGTLERGRPGGFFLGDVELTMGMTGELEIRAIKGQEYGSRFVRITIR